MIPEQGRFAKSWVVIFENKDSERMEIFEGED